MNLRGTLTSSINPQLILFPIGHVNRAVELHIWLLVGNSDYRTLRWDADPYPEVTLRQDEENAS